MAGIPDFDEHKCLAMDPDKRERVLQSAMAEFSKGFKHASTDKIAKEAGVSKGLLFHYFGTKDGLYQYTLWYAYDVFVKHYAGLIDQTQPDALERFWQAVRLKIEISRQYTMIFDLLDNACLNHLDGPVPAITQTFEDIRRQERTAILHNIDRSLFKDWITPEKAIDMVIGAAYGFAVGLGGFGASGCLEQMAEYMYILRIALYKEAAQ